MKIDKATAAIDTAMPSSTPTGSDEYACTKTGHRPTAAWGAFAAAAACGMIFGNGFKPLDVLRRNGFEAAPRPGSSSRVGMAPGQGCDLRGPVPTRIWAIIRLADIIDTIMI